MHSTYRACRNYITELMLRAIFDEEHVAVVESDLKLQGRRTVGLNEHTQ
jgi:hypothetical protein